MVAARLRTEKAFRNRDLAQWSKLKRGVELSEAQLHLKEQLQNKKKLQLQLNLSPPSNNNSVEDDIARPPVQHANRSTKNEDSRNLFLSPECSEQCFTVFSLTPDRSSYLKYMYVQSYYPPPGCRGTP